VPLSKIRTQLKMSENILRRTLAFVFDHIVSMPFRMQEVLD
jgi:hypothetical protein